MAAVAITVCVHVTATVIRIYPAAIPYSRHRSFRPVLRRTMDADVAMRRYSRAVLLDLAITIPADVRRKRIRNNLRLAGRAASLRAQWLCEWSIRHGDQE